MPTSKFHFNPFDAAFHVDPYPTFDFLRKEDPIHRNLIGNWIVTRYCDAQAILKDRRFRVDDLPVRLLQKNRHLKEGDFNTLFQTVAKWLFFLDPPQHTRVKGLLAPAFSRISAEAMRDDIQTITDSLFAKFEHAGEMDLVTDLATSLPALVVTKLLGLPLEDHEKLIIWGTVGSLIFEQPMPLERYVAENQVVLEFGQYLLEQIGQIKEQPNNGLISNLVHTHKALTDDEIVSICIMLNVAGQDTTKALIGNGLLALLQHPDSLEQLEQNPHLVKNAADELLRYDSPIQFVARQAVEDVEIAGTLIKADDVVIIYLSAANRDPEQFPNPGQLDFSRRSYGMAFGDGIHYCLGMFLSRLMAEIVISTFLRRLSDVRINTDKLDWHEGTIVRRLKSLPVKFSRRDPVPEIRAPG